MIILTLVNVILISFEADVSFPFSAFLPTMLTAVGQAGAAEGSSAWRIVGLILAAFPILIYAGCWILAKKYRVFLLIALILFVFDTLLLLLFSFGGGVSMWIDIVFHIWVLLSLFAGVKAWRKLSTLKEVAYGTGPTS